MTPEEQAAKRPFDILLACRTTGMVPHDAVTKLDPSTGYSFRDADGHTWTHSQVTKEEIFQQSLDLDPNDADPAIEVTPYGQKYYFQNDGGKICLTRFNNGPYIKTQPRIDQQQKFANAVASWKALDPQQKEAFGQEQEAKSRRIRGMDLYISRFMRDKL
jgi:hypothetical protein